MEKLPVATYIFVDRRKTGRGKSLPNRHRLLRRIKDAIRASQPQDIDAGGVKGAASPQSASSGNAVKVTRNSLHEPTFHYASGTGNHNIVLIGNDQWERGDDFPLSDEDSGAGNGQGGPGDDGEDDFIVNISRDEFYNVFFEDCELPNLQETHEKELPEMVPKHAGFQKEGNPAQLNVIRSYKNALPRRRALTTEAREQLEELEAEYEKLMNELGSQFTLASRAEVIQDRMAEIEEQITALRSVLCRSSRSSICGTRRKRRSW
jgi:uncharacterized sporulation protein YeaH/YhbH (DUF444 family)